MNSQSPQRTIGEANIKRSQATSTIDEITSQAAAGAAGIEERVVEIVKQPGQTLGFYIRDGNGLDQPSGIFISRLSPESYIQQEDLLRVGDEIVGVNGVDIRNSNLDDVVILMSIPKTLKLHIRRRYSDNSSEVARDKKPLFILHAGANYSSADLEYSSDEEDYPTPIMQRRRTGGNHVDQEPVQRALDLKRLQLEQQAGEDSNDSGLSSENSANSRDPRDLDNPRVHFAPEHHLVQVHPKTGTTMRGAKPVMSYKQQQTYKSNSASSSPTQMHRTPRRLPRSPSIEYRDMAVQCDPPQSQQFPGRYALSRLSPASQLPQDYCSDSELQALHHAAVYGRNPRRPGPSYSSGEEDDYASPRLHRHLVHHNFNADPYWANRFSGLSLHDQVDSTCDLPPPQNNSYGATQNAPHYFYNLPVSQNSLPYANPTGRPYDHPGDYTSSAPGSVAGYTDYGNWPPPDYLIDEFGRPLRYSSDSLKRHSQHLSNSLRQQSADSLLPQTYGSYIHSHSGAAAAGSGPINSMDPLHSSKGVHPLRMTKEDVKNMKGAQKFRVKDWELARFSSKVNRDEFRSCPSDRSAKALQHTHLGVDGLIRVHVIAGIGLHSSHAILRDLYCLLEVDAVRMARSMIRTSTECFEWDEQFDVFSPGAKGLGFLLYQWDPRNKHRLCFYGNLNLVSLLTSFKQRYIRSEKIALNLEPKGQLFFQISYCDVKEVLARLPNQHPGSLFGFPLDLAIKREKSGLQVPLIVKKCIDEVERRGLDVVGIYRLCGSSKNKQLLRDQFERVPHEVELSPDKVVDIHSVTGVLKDYLCELPEPLFTNALYRMMLDALHVEIPGDPKGGAKLMLSILDCLPSANQETLLVLLDHLKRVSHKAEINKMDISSLATVFGPVLLYPSSEAAKQLDPMILQLPKMIEILRYILDIWTENRDSRGRPMVSSHKMRPVSAPSQSMNQPQYRSSSMTRVQGYPSPVSQRKRSSVAGGQRSTSGDRRSYHGEMDTV